MPIRPNTDTALILALIHESIRQDLVDEEFLARHTVGWDRLAAYVLGEADGTPRTRNGWRDLWRRAGRGLFAGRRHGEPPDHGQRLVVAAAPPTTGAAVLGDRRSRLCPRPGRPSGEVSASATARSLRGQRRHPHPAAVGPASAEPGVRVHPRRPGRRHAPRPRRQVHLRRRRACLPRDPPRLLGGGQPLPPPPGPREAGGGVAPTRHDHRPRAVVDRHRPKGGHRVPGDAAAGTRRHRWCPTRRLPDRHAPGRPALRRGPLRLRDLLRAGPAPRRPRGVHGGPQRRRVDPLALRAGPPARPGRSPVRGVLGEGRAPPAPQPGGGESPVRRLPGRPGGEPAAHASGRIELWSRYRRRRAGGCRTPPGSSQPVAGQRRADQLT